MRVDGIRLSLWRAAAVYRVATLVACLYLILVRWQDLYARPAVADVAAAGMIAVTGAVAWLAWTGRAHHPAVVSADVLVTAALTLLTVWAQTAPQRHGGMTTLTTLWAAGPTLEAGILAGWAGGLAAAVVQGAVSVVVRAGYDGRTSWNVVTLIVAGTVVGYVSRVAVRSEDALAAAVAARTELLERERLARTVHDGVLQVLGLVHRTGRDEPGTWGLLAREAGEQEERLRALIASRTEPAAEDLGAALRALRNDRITVSAPARTPRLAPQAAGEVVSAVRAALHNVERHAGPDAHAWVFVEDLDDELRITVRDDGAGFAPGRLEAAEREGRLGVAGSVRARISGLGGRVEVTSRPGQGTVIEMVIPTVRR
jgi:signal transduction histidine kinase